MQLAKLAKHGNCVALNLPRSYVRELRWCTGMHVMLTIHKGHLVITPVSAPQTPKLVDFRKPGPAVGAYA